MKLSFAKGQAGAWLSGVLGFCLAGSTVAAGRVLAGTMGGFTMVFLSLAAGLPLLWLLRRRSGGGRVGRRQIGRALLQALGGIVLFRWLLMAGLQRLDGPAAGLLLGLGPLLLGLGGRLFFGDRIPRLAWVGVLVTTAGVMLVRLAPGDRGDPVGALCLLGAVLGETLMSLLGRRSPPGATAADNAWLTVAMASLLSLPLAILELALGGWPRIGAGQLAALVYYGIGPTALGYLAWSHAARRLDSASLGVANACLPVSAVLLAALVLGEAPGVLRWLALAVVALGMVLFAAGGRRGDGRTPQSPACGRGEEAGRGGHATWRPGAARPLPGRPGAPCNQSLSGARPPGNAQNIPQRSEDVSGESRRACPGQAERRAPVRPGAGVG